jgi:hypothetical protein
MDDIQKSIADYHAQRKNNILRGFIDNDLEKATGEGSRGGKVIGHTKSGKPIYEGHFGHSYSYKNFTAQDHKDAAEKHTDAKRKNEHTKMAVKLSGSGEPAAKKEEKKSPAKITMDTKMQVSENDHVTGSRDWPTPTSLNELKSSGWDFSEKDLEKLAAGQTVKDYSPNGRRVINVKLPK